jgi:type I site-specific restriction endonuclease
MLESFDSFLIGLTVTPTGQTAGFFQGNIVQDYNQERAIVDGVNVGFQVYRIEIELTAKGATIKREPGLLVHRRARKPPWDAEKNPDGRWRAFDYAEVAKRDKTNIDIFWLKDRSLGDSEDLPEPDVLAQEIADDLQTALEQFTTIAGKL